MKTFKQFIVENKLEPIAKAAVDDFRKNQKISVIDNFIKLAKDQYKLDKNSIIGILRKVGFNLPPDQLQWMV